MSDPAFLQEGWNRIQVLPVQGRCPGGSRGRVSSRRWHLTPVKLGGIFLGSILGPLHFTPQL